MEITFIVLANFYEFFNNNLATHFVTVFIVCIVQTIERICTDDPLQCDRQCETREELRRHLDKDMYLRKYLKPVSYLTK